ncbi:hypothetical protein PAPYR_4175 [Paratrimastix pyriformis]|uniref:Uncharacterized protein n=1 Tax=Paratrimastix pyriformis TaxID=342808 RepID=A0ABQ8UKP3_9EUKA|nr:hypothetical protein PAPYR_4175 [Paratrimastix pyriformis]
MFPALPGKGKPSSCAARGGSSALVTLSIPADLSNHPGVATFLESLPKNQTLISVVQWNRRSSVLTIKPASCRTMRTYRLREKVTSGEIQALFVKNALEVPGTVLEPPVTKGQKNNALISERAVFCDHMGEM